MNKYSRTVLILCSTFGLSLFTVDRVRAFSFSSNEVYTSSSIVEDGSLTIEPTNFDIFMAKNSEKVSISENEGAIKIGTDGNLTFVTDPLIEFEPVEFEPTIGIDLTGTLDNGGDLSIDVGGDLTIIGLIALSGGELTIDVGGNLMIVGSVASLGTIDNPGGNITLTADSITISSDLSNTVEPGITIVDPINIINWENTENISISENGGVITLNTGGTITLTPGSLTLTSVPESSPIPSLLLIGAMSTVLAIKHKLDRHKLNCFDYNLR